MQRRPDLIIPIRDRRQRKRVLTLKNFGKFMLAMLIFFAGLTIESHYRNSPTSDYGRLFGKQVSSQTKIETRAANVIHEAPVVEQPSVDPLLLAPAAREQYLGVNNTATQPPVRSGVATAQTIVVRGDKGVTVVGGPEGVAIVRGEEPRRPALSGGMFRQ
jgi:hypothetical protein